VGTVRRCGGGWVDNLLKINILGVLLPFPLPLERADVARRDSITKSYSYLVYTVFELSNIKEK
jgi:hypothetical protein